MTIASNFCIFRPPRLPDGIVHDNDRVMFTNNAEPGRHSRRGNNRKTIVLPSSVAISKARRKINVRQAAYRA
jgi:hypothetical protein